jgi:signal transduction histidine kinase
MKSTGFRTRLLIILALFAVVPSAILTAAYAWSVAASPLRDMVGTEPWQQVAHSGLAALDVAERGATTAADSMAIAEHRAALSRSLTNAGRLDLYAEYLPGVAALLAVVLFILIGIATVRVAGHLSRQLSRPLQELVGWTELIARGERLPDRSEGSGAPEFDVLRQRMRLAERELGRSRERAVEAGRLRAFRESARRVAHEMKNALTPVRFALARIQRGNGAPDPEALEVIDLETRRMEDIARSFAQFGRLPEGPPAEVDLAELVSYTSRSTVPDNLRLELRIDESVPAVVGHHNALSRALTNVLLNAVEASKDGGAIVVRAGRAAATTGMVEIQVSDEGMGMDAETLATIWEPYVSHKKGGTGLGLAIARQSVEAHGGRVEARSEPARGTTITFHIPAGGATRAAVHATD